MKYLLAGLFFIASNFAQALTLYPMGDSITRGIDNVGYREFLYEDLKKQGINVHFVGTQSDGAFMENHHDGHNGWTIPQLQDNISNWLEAFRPDFILLMIGANDIETHGDLKLMNEQLTKLLNTIYRLQPEVKVLVSEVTPITQADFDLKARAWNQDLKGIVSNQANQGQKISLVEMHDSLTKEDILDLDHPVPRGNQKISDLWKKAILF